MNILSFDCANRSLAVCCLTIGDIKNTNDILRNDIKINLMKVFDLTEGKKTDTVTRARSLKLCLHGIDQELKDKKITVGDVLVEYQMSLNDKSRCVSQQIVYHYTLESKVHIVGPSLKNKIFFSSTLQHCVFMAKYASKYTANKNHAKSNFLYWIDQTDNHAAIASIKKKNMDDIADSFLQIFGWLLFN